MKLKLALMLSVLTACCLWADVPWKNITIPSGQNILKNPEFIPDGIKLPGWSNYGGNPLVKSFVKYGNRSVFKVTAKGPGYHVGFNGKFQLKPDTAYTAFVLFKAEIPAKSKIALLYIELTAEGGKKQIVPAKNWNRSCSWTLVKTDFVTPESTGAIKGSIYPALFHGEPVMETALIGVVERKVLSKEKAKNILNNADFSAKSAGFPLDWNPSFEIKQFAQQEKKPFFSCRMEFGLYPEKNIVSAEKSEQRNSKQNAAHSLFTICIGKRKWELLFFRKTQKIGHLSKLR